MKVSCLIASYNQGDTLRRAIESVLMQETDFEYQIVVVDDGSTDESPDIIYEYAKEHDNMDVLLLDSNGGMMNTYRLMFGMAHGDYITLCDGDDEWISKNRLQRYADFMDRHPSVGFCTSRVLTQYNGIRTDTSLPSAEAMRRMTFDNFLVGNAQIHAQAFFIRRSVFLKYVDFEMFAKRYSLWDYPIILTLINHTKFHQLPIYTAVFHKSDESTTMTRSRARRLKYILGQYNIKASFIMKYGRKPKTLARITYKFARDMYSIAFARWYK